MANSKTSKESSFVLQVLQLATGTAINLAIGVLTTPIITRLVDPMEYGQLSMFNTYSSIALMVLTLGLDQTFVRYYYVETDVRYRKRLLDFCFGIPIILALACIPPLLMFHRLRPTLFGFDSVVMLAFIINIFVLILNRFAMLVLRLQYKTALFSSMNVLHKALYVLLVIPCVFTLQNNVIYYLVAATVTSVLVPSIICIYCEKGFWFEKASGHHFTIARKELLRFGLPLMLSSAVFLLFQATDKFCVKHYGSYSDVGVYSSAQSLMAVFAIIQTTFNTLWAPKAIDHYETHPEDRLFYKNMNAYITVIMFLFSAFMLLCKNAFVLLLGEKYREASTIIPFLMFNPVMYTISETTVTGLSIKKKTGCQVAITGISAIVNLIGNLILVPALGSKGAAVSTGVSYIVFFSLRTFFSNLYFPIDYKLPRFYTLTSIYILTSWYHMYHSFDTVIVLLFVVNIMAIGLLYKNTINQMIEIAKRHIKRSYG